MRLDVTVQPSGPRRWERQEFFVLIGVEWSPNGTHNPALEDAILERRTSLQAVSATALLGGIPAARSSRHLHACLKQPLAALDHYLRAQTALGSSSLGRAKHLPKGQHIR